MNDRRKDLKRGYRERPKPAGVFQIKNTKTGKILLGSTLNLDGRLNRHRFQLNAGVHDNRELQRDWQTHGADAFVFETLAVVEPRDDVDTSEALEALERAWADKLGAFNGYNVGPQLRDV